MLHSIKSKLAASLVACVALSAVFVQSAFAAASPTTGVDYVADLVSPIKSELTLAIVAGLTLLVVFMALRGGIGLIRRFGK